MGYRAGENSQILAMAEALGEGFETKQLTYRGHGVIGNLLRRVGIGAVDRERSSPLQPPWPDLVISAGLRNESACRWIRQQSAGRTRLVHIGRPWAGLEHFDLVITTPQYRLPARRNVLHNHTTLHRVTTARLQQAGGEFAPRLAHLSRPYIALIIGGNSGPYTFGPAAARRLARQASAMALEAGGSLLVTTSSRTPKAAADALTDAFSAPAEIFRWRPNAQDNPYFAFLGLADRIIVTGDSIAMLSEACSTRKPVYIFDPGVGNNAMHSGPGQQASVSAGERNDFRLSALFYRLMMQIGPQRLSRDLRLVHQWLVDNHHAVWLGERFPNETPPPLKDIESAVARVKALLKPRAASEVRRSTR